MGIAGRNPNREPQKRDARELFNAWNDPNAEGDPDELEGGESWIDAESPEQNARYETMVELDRGTSASLSVAACGFMPRGSL